MTKARGIPWETKVRGKIINLNKKAFDEGVLPYPVAQKLQYLVANGLKEEALATLKALEQEDKP